MTREEFQRLCRERIVFSGWCHRNESAEGRHAYGCVSGGLDFGTSGYNDAAAESLF